MKSPRQYSRLAITSSLLIFPPLGFYLMYRDTHYHYRFATLLYLSALTPVFLFLLQNLILNPQLTLVYQSLGTKQPPVSYTLLLIIFVISLVQIPIGILLNQKIKTKMNYTPLLFLSISFLMINFIMASYAISTAMNNIIKPIYNYTGFT